VRNARNIKPFKVFSGYRIRVRIADVEGNGEAVQKRNLLVHDLTLNIVYTGHQMYLLWTQSFTVDVAFTIQPRAELHPPFTR
jgi:hypothetical protein